MQASLLEAQLFAVKEAVASVTNSVAAEQAAQGAGAQAAGTAMDGAAAAALVAAAERIASALEIPLENSSVRGTAGDAATRDDTARGAVGPDAAGDAGADGDALARFLASTPDDEDESDDDLDPYRYVLGD